MKHSLSALVQSAGLCTLLTTGMLAATWQPIPAQAEEQRKIVLAPNQFQESYLEQVTVSGGIRAGLMQQSNLDHIDMENLHIHLLRPVEQPKNMLCVNMVSRDGRYAASWQYMLGPQPAGELLVSIPSKYQEQISNYAADALVVLAAISGQDCVSGELLQYAPASWGPANGNPYVLYVNSGNTDTAIGVPGMATRGGCTRINADSTIAYDTACVIAQEVLATPKSIYLLRNNFGKRLPNVEIPVR